MDKFFKIDNGLFWTNPQGYTVWVYPDGTINFSRVESEGDEAITREEFTAAALQAIEKLKAQGIDIGTDWLPKWEPKVGEVVWVWDDDSKLLTCATFLEFRPKSSYPYQVIDGSTWNNCSPFTGEIPEPFKSRWEAEGNGPA